VCVDAKDFDHYKRSVSDSRESAKGSNTCTLSLNLLNSSDIRRDTTGEDAFTNIGSIFRDTVDLVLARMSAFSRGWRHKSSYNKPLVSRDDCAVDRNLNVGAADYFLVVRRELSFGKFPKIRILVTMRVRNASAKKTHSNFLITIL